MIKRSPRISKKIVWFLIYFFLLFNLLLLFFGAKEDFTSKEFKIYSYDLFTKKWCQRDKKTNYWFQNSEEVIKKILNHIAIINQKNITDNSFTDLRILNVYSFSDYLVIDLSLEFTQIKEKIVELYYLGSFLYFIKNNYKNIQQVKFLIGGYEFKTLSGLYDYSQFINILKLVEIEFPPCS